MDEKTALNRMMKQYDGKVLEFILSHETEILQQLKEDKEYQEGISEIPVIPVFDQYISQLERELETPKRIAKIGLVHSMIEKICSKSPYIAEKFNDPRVISLIGLEYQKNYVKEVIQNYKDRFYYSSLPNIHIYALTHK